MDKNTLFSSFGKWVSPIFSKRFYQDLASSDQDKYVKKLTTPAYLLLFLHAQLQQREGLRAIADDALGKLFQRELGFTSISPSQLSANINRLMLNCFNVSLRIWFNGFEPAPYPLP